MDENLTSSASLRTLIRSTAFVSCRRKYRRRRRQPGSQRDSQTHEDTDSRIGDGNSWMPDWLTEGLLLLQRPPSRKTAKEPSRNRRGVWFGRGRAEGGAEADGCGRERSYR